MSAWAAGPPQRAFAPAVCRSRCAGWPKRLSRRLRRQSTSIAPAPDQIATITMHRGQNQGAGRVYACFVPTSEKTPPLAPSVRSRTEPSRTTDGEAYRSFACSRCACSASATGPDALPVRDEECSCMVGTRWSIAIGAEGCKLPDPPPLAITRTEFSCPRPDVDLHSDPRSSRTRSQGGPAQAGCSSSGHRRRWPARLMQVQLRRTTHWFLDGGWTRRSRPSR